MDEHLTRSLYLGVAIFLVIAAFTSFFALFGGYQDYYSHASELSNFDRLKIEEPASSKPFMRGDEVVSLILEKRRADESTGLQELYSDGITQERLEGVALDYTERYPDIYVGVDNANLVSYKDIDLTSIYPGDNYEAEFTFDSSGKTVKIGLIKR